MEKAVRNKSVHLLVIDDEYEYCEKLRKDAVKHNFLVTHYQNLEEGFENLEKYKKFKALILDDRCVLNKDQEPGTAKTNFVFHAITRLHHLELEDNRYIPYCVNSYNPDEFSEDLEGITLVFKKKEQHSEMFDHLRGKIEIMNETQIKRKHEDVFLFIHKYLDHEDEDLMLELLSNAEEKDNTSIVTNFGILRRLEEKLMDVICKIFLKAEPDQFKKQRSNRTKGIIRHLKNNQFLPQYLYNFSMDLYNIPSKFGNHNPYTVKQINFHLPGNYTITSLCNSFMELICWANDLLEKPVNNITE